MKCEYTYIIAGTYEQAKLCAIKHEILPRKFVYVESVEKLMGLALDEIWLTGTYYMNSGSRETVDYAAQRNIKMVFK